MATKIEKLKEINETINKIIIKMETKLFVENQHNIGFNYEKKYKK